MRVRTVNWLTYNRVQNQLIWRSYRKSKKGDVFSKHTVYNIVVFTYLISYALFFSFRFWVVNFSCIVSVNSGKLEKRRKESPWMPPLTKALSSEISDLCITLQQRTKVAALSQNWGHVPLMPPPFPRLCVDVDVSLKISVRREGGIAEWVS